MIKDDFIILSPNEIDLRRSPISKSIGEATFVLGAFNPGFTELPNGNLLLIARIAESIDNPIDGKDIRYIRWTPEDGFRSEKFPLEFTDRKDPRKFRCINYRENRVYGLTSFSWLLPVELTPDGREIIGMHYDKAIFPEMRFQEYGIEDARITRIENQYFMTVCSVSSERQSTVLYSSTDGLNYKSEGMILDHQNKDMVIFPEKINNRYYALTRPLGHHYFLPPDSEQFQGGSIKFAESLDLRYWKPVDYDGFRIKSSKKFQKFGAGAPPLRTELGWLVLLHGVEKNGEVGIYKTYAVLLDSENPAKILRMNLDNEILNSKPEITRDLEKQQYVNDVVYTTGAVEKEDSIILASGELDLCCRLTRIDKKELLKKLTD